MTLTFDVTEDDFWAGQEHQTFKSPEMKRYLRAVIWGASVMVLVLMPLLQLLTTPRHLLVPGLIGTVTGAVIGLLFMMVFLRLIMRLSRPLVRAFFRKTIDQAIGKHELELLPRGLQIVTPHGEQVVYWHSIGNIAATPQHTFIYLTRMQTVIVPQKRITSGNYPAFMQAFADVYAARRDHALAEVNVPAVPVAAPSLPVASETQVQQTVGQGRA